MVPPFNGCPHPCIHQVEEVRGFDESQGRDVLGVAPMVVPLELIKKIFEV